MLQATPFLASHRYGGLLSRHAAAFRPLQPCVSAYVARAEILETYFDLAIFEQHFQTTTTIPDLHLKISDLQGVLLNSKSSILSTQKDVFTHGMLKYQALKKGQEYCSVEISLKNFCTGHKPPPTTLDTALVPVAALFDIANLFLDSVYHQ